MKVGLVRRAALMSEAKLAATARRADWEARLARKSGGRVDEEGHLARVAVDEAGPALIAARGA